jgi:hypothetical protein
VDEWTRDRSEAEPAICREIEDQALKGVLDVPDPALAAHQLIHLVVNEAVSSSRHGLRVLSDAEIDQIVDDGVTLWLRAYRVR